jgi:hypothetical protein
VGVALQVTAVSASTAIAEGATCKAITVQLQALALLAVAGPHGPVRRTDKTAAAPAQKQKLAAARTLQHAAEQMMMVTLEAS